ncbi:MULTISPECIES: class I SAM-dependent methyltransferase [Actinoplanes]|uniref:class I SAM-dependent methyltransferase n=1 Tax=Actinoplanes TaxID=1865 RepID=UPI0005F2D1A8|nr:MULTISPECIES: class I SAM-dependent methyltransferase [Actinoplanes]GLY04332.1 hypothetical protein Acsp01_47110 [Actinoplanes sp. NBRC 101535]
MFAAGNPARAGSGVYLAEQTSPPRSLVVGGRRLTRFMDEIYLDRPCEKLSPKKIQVLNAARRPLLDRADVAQVNASVREALAGGVRASGATSVLEWGCGFHTMRELFPGVSYAGVDIDPDVVRVARAEAAGVPFHQADQDLAALPDASFDAIVSAFVFHFRLPRLHLATIHRVLRPEGFLLANVYRRSARSRRELVDELHRAGLRVERAPDQARLCADHEFWCLRRADSPDPGRAAAALQWVRGADRP